MTSTEMKHILSSLSKEDIIKLLLKLYNLSKSNKEYIHNSLAVVDEKSLLMKYMDLINNEFYPKKGDPKLRYSFINKSIKEFISLTKNKEYIAFLQLYYVENGVNFTNDYGDIDEQFYDRIAIAYKKALSYIFINKIDKKFYNKCFEIYSNTKDIGWGFHDYMSDLFYAFYEEQIENEVRHST
jgi:hypothetical protein